MSGSQSWPPALQDCSAGLERGKKSPTSKQATMKSLRSATQVGEFCPSALPAAQQCHWTHGSYLASDLPPNRPKRGEGAAFSTPVSYDAGLSKLPSGTVGSSTEPDDGFPCTACGL